jgi:hypothetical protein
MDLSNSIVKQLGKIDSSLIRFCRWPALASEFARHLMPSVFDLVLNPLMHPRFHCLHARFRPRSVVLSHPSSPVISLSPHWSSLTAAWASSQRRTSCGGACWTWPRPPTPPGPVSPHPQPWQRASARRRALEWEGREHGELCFFACLFYFFAELPCHP